ncbi:MAG: DegT/DnrJ/EryC1/StrS family aminotransferase [Promethearchaeota archaeon]
MPGPGMYFIGEEEKKALLDVIEGGYIYRYGESSNINFKQKVLKLERDFESFIGSKYALAVNSGTSALIVALMALGIGPGDEVIVPGYTYIASISSIIFARAIPILAEIDETLTLDPKDIEKKITPRTKAIMLVHMLGNPGYLTEIREIAKKNNIFLIEDCAQALGAKYGNKYVGTFGEIGIFSFNINKTITGGDGGMVITDDEKLYKRAFAIHDQGHFPLREGVEQGKRTLLGLTFRMTEFTGAVVGVQLKKLENIINHLKNNKARLKSHIEDINQIKFRKLTDENGEISTLLTIIMPTIKSAVKMGEKLGCGVVADSGWHVYNNMEHFLGKMTVSEEGCPFNCPFYKGPEPVYSKGMLPQTDNILKRSINISIGVSDKGLGSNYGLSVDNTPAEIDKIGEELRKVILESLKIN